MSLESMMPQILSTVAPFSSCPQSFPASGSFPMSQLFAWSGQSIGASASTSVLPMNIQDWFPLGWTGWISLKSKGLSRVFLNTTVQKHQFFSAQPYLGSNSHICTWKTTALTRQIFVSKMMSLFFNMRPRLVIAFVPGSKHLLISWLQSPSLVILEPKKIKVCLCFHCFHISLPWSDGTGCHDLSFWMLRFKPPFSLSSFTFIKRLFSSSSLSVIRVVSSAYLRLLIFLPAILMATCASSRLAIHMMYHFFWGWLTLNSPTWGQQGSSPFHWPVLIIL